jgi:hypothetical protein
MAKKKKKKSHGGGAPAPAGTKLPKMAQDIVDMSQGSYAAQPWLVKAQAEYGPKFAAAEAATAGGRAAEESRQIQQNFGATYEALMASEPYREATEGFRQNVASNNRIYGALGAQAEEDLALGGRLSGDEQREASQASRAAWNDRGLVTSGRSAVDEVLARVSMSNARKRERQGFAAQVAAQGTAVTTQNMSVAASQFDPYQRLFGTGGSAVTGTLNSDELFTPYAQPAVDIYAADKNYAAAMAQLASAEKMQKAGFAHDAKMTKLNASYDARTNAANIAAARSASRNSAMTTGAVTGIGVGAMALGAGASIGVAGGAGIAAAAIIM